MHPVIRSTMKTSTNIFPLWGVRYASRDFVESRKRNNAKASRAYNSIPSSWSGHGLCLFERRPLPPSCRGEKVQLKFNDICFYVFYYCSFPSHPLHSFHTLWDSVELSMPTLISLLFYTVLPAAPHPCYSFYLTYSDIWMFFFLTM